ncbi:MAG: hypothetical protein AAF773_08875 [Cyanobacteria bacterium P01_D01_bin.115]
MTRPSDQAATKLADEPPFERWAERFWLLSEPSRLPMLSVIGQSERHVTEICALTGWHVKPMYPNNYSDLRQPVQWPIAGSASVGTTGRFVSALPPVFR